MKKGKVYNQEIVLLKFPIFTFNYAVIFVLLCFFCLALSHKICIWQNFNVLFPCDSDVTEECISALYLG